MRAALPCIPMEGLTEPQALSSGQCVRWTDSPVVSSQATPSFKRKKALLHVPALLPFR